LETSKMFIAMNRFTVIKEQSLRGFVGGTSVASRRGQGLPGISLAAGSGARGPGALFISYNMGVARGFYGMDQVRTIPCCPSTRGRAQAAHTRPPGIRRVRSHPDDRNHASVRIADVLRLELVTGELYGAGLTNAGTPCACFRDRGMSAEAPKSHCENPLMIKELRRPKLTECDWQFPPGETASSVFRRVRKLKSPHRQCVASSVKG
jgi:hypothetical protein